MTVYVIADIKVTDDGWVPAYAAAVHEIVHKHGGKYLARSGNVKTLEGKPRDTTLIAHVQFPSAEAVEAFATDPDYAPYAAEPHNRGSPACPSGRRNKPPLATGLALIRRLPVGARALSSESRRPQSSNK